jgi:hypothetical protein
MIPIFIVLKFKSSRVQGDNAYGELHGAAVKTAMLDDE